VPPPFWLVAVPALDLAAASGAAASAITLALALARCRGGMRQPWDTRDGGEAAKIGT
jgi:hypothetical protein